MAKKEKSLRESSDFSGLIIPLDEVINLNLS